MCHPGTADAGDNDEDELVPLKLKETKRFKDRKVIGMEIGGQMTFLLAVSNNTPAPQPAAAATANGTNQEEARRAAHGTSAAEPSQNGDQSAHTGQAASADGPPEPVPMDSS